MQATTLTFRISQGITRDAVQPSHPLSSTFSPAVDWEMSPRDIRSKFLEPIYFALCGKRVSTSMIKLWTVSKRDNPG